MSDDSKWPPRSCDRCGAEDEDIGGIIVESRDRDEFEVMLCISCQGSDDASLFERFVEAIIAVMDTGSVSGNEPFIAKQADSLVKQASSAIEEWTA